MGAKSNQFTLKQTLKYRRYYKTFVVGSGAFLLAFLISSVFAPVQNSDASTVRISNNTSDFYIDITSTDLLTLDVEATPSGQLASASDSINVKTNSPTGYTLYVSTANNDNNIYRDGDSSTSSQGYFYPTTGSTSAPAALSQNTWGFALDRSSGSTYSANFADITNYNTGTGIPTGSSTWAAVPGYASPEPIGNNDADNLSYGGDDYAIYYGINASTALPSGNYSTTVTYTAISEGVNVFDTMQDFTAEKCDIMPTDSSISLTDSRDGKYYRVTKMKDGHCWMTDNLALDGTDKAGNVRTLTPNDSDVTSNVTLAKNIESGTPSNATDVQIFSGVANDYISEEEAQAYTYAVANDTKYGNLYNWFAATARSGTSTLTTEATMSICPKGWRLPSQTGDWSYGNLLKAYGAGTGENVGAGETGGSYVRIAQKAPLYFTLAGIYGNLPYDQDRVTHYWSRTPMSDMSDNAYPLNLNSENGDFLPQYPYNKMYGFSVRCVFAGQKDEIMQNFTSTMCNNLALSTSSADNRKTMIDSRDGKFYKISRLADNPGTTGTNGTCWMVSNLALDGADPLGTVRTLTPSDSNVTQNRPLAANVSGTVAAEYDKVQINSSVANNTTTQKNYDYAVVSDIKYGNLYNWNAATAGVGKQTTTGIVVESICPSGWRLPDYGLSGSEKTWGNLMGKVGYSDTSTTNGDYVVATQEGPLYMPLAGMSSGSHDDGQGHIAFYWSRTVRAGDSNCAHLMGINSEYGYFDPNTVTGKLNGFSVRCVTE